MNYNNILTGYKINSQLPLDAKSNVASEAIIKSLGTSSKLAYTYEKGLIIYCQLEGTRYEWREVKSVEDTPGILNTGNFTYPTNWVVAGVDYSNKVYNFFNIKQVAQVQSDWNATTGVSVIANKPTIPTIVPQVQSDWNSISGVSFIANKPTITPQVQSDWNSSSGVSTILNKPQIINPPFASINDGFFVRNRDETQFGTLGAYSYDFSNATLGAYDDTYGQVGSIGVHPTEMYGALGDSCFTNGFNLSAQGYGDVLFGVYNHSDTSSQFSTIIGRNNYNNSSNSFIGGSYNQAPYTYLGHKLIFGNGNVVNGAASLTSGVALINKSFATTVLGQANLDYPNTEQGHNITTAPLLIVGNGSVSVPIGLWSAVTRSNAFVLLRNGLATLPSVTNTLITEDATGKAVVTKEYLTSVFSTFSIDTLQKVITYPADFTGTNYTLNSADNNYELIVDNGATAVTITVPAGLISKIGIGFTQKGTGDVTYVQSSTMIQNPIGLKIKGQFYQTYLSQEGSTNVFYLGGNTKL